MEEDTEAADEEPQEYIQRDGSQLQNSDLETAAKVLGEDIMFVQKKVISAVEKGSRNEREIKEDVESVSKAMIWLVRGDHAIKALKG